MADPFFSDEDVARIHAGIDDILRGALSMGPNVAAFEREFAAVSGVRHAIAMNACTSALEVALLGLGVAPGDEVIVPAETFIATAMAVHLVGAVPVFVEIAEPTFCLDLEDAKRRITPRTRGMIMVYMGGMIPPEILDVRDFCRSRGLFLIEDAAHAPGASRYGKVAGSFGDAGCFSFFPTKVITAGEGGMLTTDDDSLAEFARSLQHRGRDFSVETERYALPGRNIRMTEMSALVGRIQLGHLSEYLAQRRRVLGHYRAAFADDSRVKLIAPDVDEASSCWKVPVLLPEVVDRERVTEQMHQAGVMVDWAYQPAVHLQPVFRKLYGTREGFLPKSERLLGRHLCLPCHPRITDAEAIFVAETLKGALDREGVTP